MQKVTGFVWSQVCSTGAVALLECLQTHACLEVANFWDCNLGDPMHAIDASPQLSPRAGRKSTGGKKGKKGGKSKGSKTPKTPKSPPAEGTHKQTLFFGSPHDQAFWEVEESVFICVVLFTHHESCVRR